MIISTPHLQLPLDSPNNAPPPFISFSFLKKTNSPLNPVSAALYTRGGGSHPLEHGYLPVATPLNKSDCLPMHPSMRMAPQLGVGPRELSLIKLAFCLASSCAGNHRCCELRRATALPSPEGGTSQPSFHPPALPFFLLALPQWALSLGPESPQSLSLSTLTRSLCSN